MSEPDLSRYRPNVAAAVFNSDGLVFIGKRIQRRGAYSWQMPQGGMDPNESPEDAVFRELAEETGMTKDMVHPLGCIQRWLVYDFPTDDRKGGPMARRWCGQKQRWFAFRFVGREDDINLLADARPEFDAWRWERLFVLPTLVIPWKRSVYEEVVGAFERFTRA